MNTSNTLSIAIPIPTVAGTPYAGGFYAGRANINGALYAIIVSPKGAGELTMRWSENSASVPGAASYFDGLANTRAMADADSSLAKTVLGLDINGKSDWYIPARDEQEICYRNLKPTTDSNYEYRGDNPSSVPPGYIYTASVPAQTAAAAFQTGNDEAFAVDDWYWNSTQGSADTDFAWMQDFSNGSQILSRKSNACRVRAVRRELIIE